MSKEKDPFEIKSLGEFIEQFEKQGKTKSYDDNFIKAANGFFATCSDQHFLSENLSCKIYIPKGAFGSFEDINMTLLQAAIISAPNFIDKSYDEFNPIRDHRLIIAIASKMAKSKSPIVQSHLASCVAYLLQIQLNQKDVENILKPLVEVADVNVSFSLKNIYEVTGTKLSEIVSLRKLAENNEYQEFFKEASIGNQSGSETPAKEQIKFRELLPKENESEKEENEKIKNAEVLFKVTNNKTIKNHNTISLDEALFFIKHYTETAQTDNGFAKLFFRHIQQIAVETLILASLSEISTEQEKLLKKVVTDYIECLETLLKEKVINLENPEEKLDYITVVLNYRQFSDLPWNTELIKRGQECFVSLWKGKDEQILANGFFKEVAKELEKEDLLYSTKKDNRRKAMKFTHSNIAIIKVATSNKNEEGKSSDEGERTPRDYDNRTKDSSSATKNRQQVKQ